MAFKFIALAAIVAVANAGIVPLAQVGYQTAPVAYAAPLTSTIVSKTVEEYDHHPQYSFNYGVSDALSGDHKSQHETRDGDKVTGSYSLIDADGTKRTVDYVADDVNGFNAVVRREPAVAVATPVVKTVAAAIPAATYGAAPAYAYQAAPVAHATFFAQPHYSQIYV